MIHATVNAARLRAGLDDDGRQAGMTLCGREVRSLAWLSEEIRAVCIVTERPLSSTGLTVSRNDTPTCPQCMVRWDAIQEGAEP